MDLGQEKAYSSLKIRELTTLLSPATQINRLQHRHLHLPERKEHKKAFEKESVTPCVMVVSHRRRIPS